MEIIAFLSIFFLVIAGLMNSANYIESLGVSMETINCDSGLNKTSDRIYMDDGVISYQDIYSGEFIYIKMIDGDQCSVRSFRVKPESDDEADK